MAFIAKTDLLVQIHEDELNEMTRSDDTIVSAAINATIAEMRTYLFDSYEVDTIFSKTGSARNQLLVNLACDIAIYLLTARNQAGQDVADRETRYKRAIGWLKQAQKTEIYSDLPRREETQQTHINYGSNAKRSNYY